MAWYDMAAAFLAALLTGLGVGSGGIFVIYLLLVRGMPQLEAQGMNLLFFLFAAGAALPTHIRRRGADLPVLFFILTFGLAGSYFGSAAGKVLDAGLLRRIFGVLMLLCGAAGLLLPRLRKSKKDPKSPGGAAPGGTRPADPAENTGE